MSLLGRLEHVSKTETLEGFTIGVLNIRSPHEKTLFGHEKIKESSNQKAGITLQCAGGNRSSDGATLTPFLPHSTQIRAWLNLLLLF